MLMVPFPGGQGGDGGCCGNGGGLANTGGVVTVSASTFTGNAAGDGGAGGVGGQGGAPSGLEGGAGGMGGRGADASSGGAIASTGGALSVVDSTLSANRSGVGGSGGAVGPGTGGGGGNAGGGSGGGGLFVGGGTAVLSNVTVSGNQVGAPGAPGTGSSPGPAPAGIGGGVHTIGAGTTQMRGVLLASNQLGNCAGTPPVDLGHNLSFGDASCPVGFAHGDPKLGPLADNGGPAKTIALLAGSAAIDQIPATGAGCPATDERGVARPAGTACDIGAYEVAPPQAAATPATNVSSGGATVNGLVTPDQATASIHFEFGTTTAYGTQTPAQTLSGLAALPASAPVAGLLANTTYHYRVVATSADGTTASPDATFTTAPPPPTPTPPRTPTPIPTARPRLTKLAVHLSRPKPPKHRTSHKAKTKPTATITYTDSGVATTKLTLSTVTTGARHGARCVKRSRKVHGKSCTLLTRIVTLTHHDRAGTNSVRVTGHLLAKGHYEVTATPGSGATVTAKFGVR